MRIGAGRGKVVGNGAGRGKGVVEEKGWGGAGKRKGLRGW